MAAKRNTTKNPAAVQLAAGTLSKAQTEKSLEETKSDAVIIRATLDKMLPRFQEAALKAIPPEFYVSTALTVLRGSDKLREAAIGAPETLIDSMIKAIQLGLSLEPALGQAYLIPRKNKNKGYRQEVTFMPGYRGYLAKMWRSEKISDITVRVVHENDTFEMTFGHPATLVHKFDIRKERGEALGVWGGFHTVNGGFQFDYMSADEILTIKKRAADNSIWLSDELEMWKKTIIRRIYKMAPIEDLKLAEMNAIDNELSSDLDPEKEVQQSEKIVVPMTEPFTATSGGEVRYEEVPSSQVSPPPVKETPRKGVTKKEVPPEKEKLFADNGESSIYDDLMKRADEVKSPVEARVIYDEATKKHQEFLIGVTHLNEIKNSLVLAVQLLGKPDAKAPKAPAKDKVPATPSSLKRDDIFARAKTVKAKGGLFALKTEATSLKKSGQLTEEHFMEVTALLQQLFEGMK